MKRSAILYIRVTPQNKKWVEIQAKRAGVSVSQWMDGILSKQRKNARRERAPLVRREVKL